MKVPIRYRLTVLFTVLASALIFLSSVFVYLRTSRSLHKDFQREMVHDGRLLAELFKEELKLNALNEFEEELHEFDVELQVLNQKNQVVVQSKGWAGLHIALSEEERIRTFQQSIFKELRRNNTSFGLFSRPIHIPSGDNYILCIVRPQEPLLKQKWTLLKWMSIINPLMIFWAALVGYFFTKRMLLAEAQAFDRLKRFTADVSHELRIPLTSLRGHLEVALRNERTSGEYQKTIQYALDEAEHLSQLTQDLLLLAQSDSNSIPLNIQNVRVDDFMKDVFSLIENYVDEKNIKKIFLPVHSFNFRFDPDRIKQLLLILVDNAVKYSLSGGAVTLGAEKSRDQFVLTVRDQGIGISQEDQEKIFERFYRVDKARSREQGGAGLGLSIARWIVDAHGGQIKVESQLGKGSVFTVILP